MHVVVSFILLVISFILLVVWFFLVVVLLLRGCDSSSSWLWFFFFFVVAILLLRGCDSSSSFTSCARYGSCSFLLLPPLLAWLWFFFFLFPRYWMLLFCMLFILVRCCCFVCYLYWFDVVVWSNVANKNDIFLEKLHMDDQSVWFFFCFVEWFFSIF